MENLQFICGYTNDMVYSIIPINSINIIKINTNRVKGTTTSVYIQTTKGTEVVLQDIDTEFIADYFGLNIS